MSNNRDDHDKDPLRQGDPKRPHATLDLKAVEIKTPEQRAAESKAAAAAATAKDAGKNDATKSGTSTADPKVVKAAEQATKDIKSDQAKQPTASATATKAAGSVPPTAKPATATATPPPAAARRGGFGSFLTHAAAGLFGGFLALLGADTLAPQLEQLGLPARTAGSEATKAFDNRIAALEQASKAAAQAGDPKLSQQLAANAARLEKLEQLEARLAKVAESQAAIKAQSEQLAAKLAQVPAEGATSDPRIARLEERLAMLASASDGGKAAGALPQLAAVTGKIADLESTLSNQMAALRRSVGEDIESRIAKSAEAAEAARSGTLRIDRELADVKTESVRLGQRMEALKADTERVSETLRVVQEETGKLTSGLDAVKGDLAARFKAAAKPEDVASAIAPVAGKVAALEQSVQGVVKAEDNRKANAERIVLSLELANMKRVIDRGLGYAEELQQVKKAAAGKVDLAALEKYKTEGVPTLPELQSGFRPLAHKIIDAATAPADSGVFDRLLSGAKSVVRVRKVNHSPDDDSVEAIVARMDQAIDDGRIADFLALKDKLPDKARAPAAAFIQKVEARNAVDKAMKEIESQLKTSLGGVEGAAAAPAAK